MIDAEPLTLKNKQRLIVPLVSLVILALAFFPVFFLIDFDDVDLGKAGLAISAFMLLFGWLAVSAWNAPFEATFGPTLTVRKLLRERAYSHDMIRRWRFMHPNSPPSQELPIENGLIEIKLSDGTRFRSEVSRAESERALSWLKK